MPIRKRAEHKRAKCESKKMSCTIAVVQARDDYNVGRGQKWRNTEHILVIEASAC